MLGHAGAALKQAGQRVAAGHQRYHMGFEQIEEMALAGSSA
jgi:hypothetical protein